MSNEKNSTGRENLDPTQQEIVKPSPTGENLVEDQRLRTKLTSLLEVGLAQLEERFPTLRLNQLDALTKLLNFLKTNPELMGYFIQPTGAGKTFLFGLIIHILQVPTLVLVPNTPLLENTKKQFLDVSMNEADIGLVGGGFKERGRRVTVMTYQSFLRTGIPDDVELVVCDEAHRSLGDGTSARLWGEEEISQEEEDQENEALDLLSREKERLILGFTATQDLAKKSVSQRFKTQIARTSYRNLTDAKILKKFKSIFIPANINAKKEGKTLTKDQETELLGEAGVYAKLLKRYKEFETENPSITLRTAVFCNTVGNCERFQELAAAQGYTSMIVTGTVGKDDLKKAEQALLAGAIDMIITVDRLKEGWDFPPLNAVIWARATNSPASIIQGAGRAARAYKDELMAYIFETIWFVGKEKMETEMARVARDDADKDKGLSLKDRSETALSLADALLAIDEDPQGLLINEEEGFFKEKMIKLNGEGVGQYLLEGQWREVVELGTYLEALGYHVGYAGVLGDIRRLCTPISVEGRAEAKTSLWKIVFEKPILYLKEEVDAKIPSLGLKKVAKGVKNGVGYVQIGKERIEVVEVRSYAEYLKILPEDLYTAANKAGVHPLESCTTIHRESCFKKTDIDRIIEEKAIPVELLLNGTGAVLKQGVWVQAVALEPYAKGQRIDPRELECEIRNANLESLKPKGRISRGREVTEHSLFLKTDVDKIITEKVPRIIKMAEQNNGQAVIELEGTPTEIVFIEDYVVSRDFQKRAKGIFVPQVKAIITQKGINPIPGYQVRIRGKFWPIYKKSEIDSLIES